MLAIALTDAWIEKFGGDSLSEQRRNVEGYLATLRRPADQRAGRVAIYG